MSLAELLPLDELAPVDLATVMSVAALARRVDRKYLVPIEDAARLVRGLADSHHVLRIAGRRATTYRSTYLDTGELRLCRDHLQGRRLRWKARSRLYLEDGLCRFEVKVRGARGETVKHAVDLDPSSYGGCGPAERAFIAAVLGEDHPAVPQLRPVLEIGYTRATLVDLRAGTRLTIDHGVLGRPTRARTPVLAAASVAVDTGLVIVETKSGPRPGAGDRLLARMGHRPLALSKYATSAALLAPDIADNQVRRLVGRGVRVHDESALTGQEAS
ncbi:polyphosphate polymerase domain-containing protein [Nocardioides aquiterrae]|uniref:VTC domain-containing protein n=1 Tax=Nocardioides aquiterrae TaxID=203799 RepID=A0ABN1UF05_9ACTN